MLLFRSCCALLAGCLSLSSALAFAGQSDSPVLNSDSIEGKLREELQTAVTRDLQLHGAWADLIRTQTGTYRVALIVDSEPEIGSTQQTTMIRLISKYLSRNKYSLEVIRLPFHEMLTNLQESVELQPAYGGAVVDDAYYMSGPEDTLFINLVGRVATDDQRTDIISLCNDLIRRYFGPLTDRVRLAKADPPADNVLGVRLVHPSEQTAAQCFNRGVVAYTQRNYRLAYRFFTRARVDAPLQVHLQYWRIVSLIGMGQDAKAAVILTDLRNRSKSPGEAKDEAGVLQSLEKVQGPIRGRLIAIQDYLLAQGGTPPWEAGPVTSTITNPRPAQSPRRW